ncbi:MAG: hypothetical protein M1837_004976 [Sclerophora amabilis]|nr:MAG: hypothetical protein M1837_004976 [Sclerophora amabilis]
MPLDGSSFTALNIPPTTATPEWMGSFSLHASPNTDLWRKPPSRDTSTAPILYTILRHPFIAAEVTVSADWELEWDQGGLVIFAGAPPGHVPPQVTQASPPSTTSSITTSSTTPSPSESPHSSLTPPAALSPPPYFQPPPASKWVKAGLEFYGGVCHASSVVATSDGADWALAPLSPSTTASSPSSFAHHQSLSDLRVKLERIGHALWIWFEDPVAGWKKLREVTWFFWGVEDKAVRVGVYASRPANLGVSQFALRNGGATETGDLSRDEHRGLVVEFDGLEIF